MMSGRQQAGPRCSGPAWPATATGRAALLTPPRRARPGNEILDGIKGRIHPTASMAWANLHDHDHDAGIPCDDRPRRDSPLGCRSPAHSKGCCTHVARVWLFRGEAAALAGGFSGSCRRVSASRRVDRTIRRQPSFMRQRSFRNPETLPDHDDNPPGCDNPPAGTRQPSRMRQPSSRNTTTLPDVTARSWLTRMEPHPGHNAGAGVPPMRQRWACPADARLDQLVTGVLDGSSLSVTSAD